MGDGGGVSEHERRLYHGYLDRLGGWARVCIIFSHAWVAEENELILDYLDCLGERLDSFQETGAFVHLYSLSNPNATCPE